MSHRARRVVSVVLITIAGLMALVGGVSLWGRKAIFDPQGFAGRATETLQSEDVRQVLAEQVTTQLIERGSAELVTIRPLVKTIVAGVIGSRPFEPVFRNAAQQVHAAIFSDDETIVLKLVDVTILVTGALKAVDPRAAEMIPENFTDNLIHLRNRDFATSLIAAAREIRHLGWLFPLLSLLLFVTAIAIDPNRHRAIAGVGVALALAGAVVFVSLVIGKTLLTYPIGDPEIADAVRAVWNVFAWDLRVWSVALGVIGLALAAAARSTVKSVDVRRQLQNVFDIVTYLPEARWAQIARALIFIVVSAAMIAWPTRFAQGFFVVIGVFTLYYGLIELIRATGLSPDDGDTEEISAGAFWGQIGNQTIKYAFLLAAAVGVFFVILWLWPGAQFAALDFRKGVADDGCNGHVELCDRHFDKVALVASHNSMSAANEPGWFFASHFGTIPEQLEYGVRGFLIDTHFGFPVDRGVRTDTDLSREAMVEMFGEEVVAAKERIQETFGEIEPGARSEVYLCHGLCEVGATPLIQTLTAMREFLERNPREVLVIFIQDVVPPEPTAAVFEEAGLADYAYTHVPGSQWPTLREMIDANQRLLVMAENDGGGPDWYHAGFVLTQETPYKYHSPDEFSCAANRGEPESPLFQLNHWIEKVTPSPADADQVNAYSVLLARALECEAKRGMIPNLVAVNFYARGDVLKVVDALNGVTATYETTESMQPDSLPIPSVEGDPE